jgi:hypothetical protein
VQLKSAILFVGDITDGSREIQVSINSTLDVYGGTSLVDSFSFFLLGWLVVLRKRNGATSLTQDTSGITCIAAYEKIVCDQKNVGRAALTFHHFR